MRKTLSEKQKLLINSEGKTILQACPGSGKTFVVAHKVLADTTRWSKKNSGIAVLSFTNVASNELIKTISDISDGYRVGYPHFVGTIDSFIAQYLFMPFGAIIMGCKGIRPSIIQDGHCISVQAYIDLIWKRECYSNNCSPLDFYYDSDGKICCIDKDLSSCPVRSSKPCEALKKFCYSRGYATYSDVTQISLRLLEGCPQISSLLCKRFPNLIVDEAQDTSAEQMRIFELLCKYGVQNIMLIGDPDQAIYEWRDADPSVFIDKYNSDEWNAQLLNENYRCSQLICDATHVFSSLSEASTAKGATAAFEFKPQVLKYDAKDKDKAVRYFLCKCAEHNIDLSSDSVAVLVRGKAGLLGKDYSAIDDLWQNDITKILAEATFEKSSKRIQRAMLLVERALYYLFIDSSHDNIIDVKKVAERVPILVWEKMVIFLCQKLPPSSITMREWKPAISAILSALLLNFPYALVGSVEIKTKQRVKKAAISDFLDQPMRDFFEKSYDHGYLNTTIHQVKGRTFDAVLLIIATTGKLTSNMINKKPIDSEQIRTAYVAMTRARKILMIAVPNSIQNKTLTRFPASKWDIADILA